MSGSQVAHFLKVIGNGSEADGIVAVYCAGWLVGAGQALAIIGAGYGAYRLSRWGYNKLKDYKQNNKYIAIAGNEN